MAFSRREFLELSGLAAVSVSLPSFAAAGTPRDRVLVLIQLAGGNDGLNTVVPLRDPLYRKLRPGLALPEGEVLALPKSELALNAGMARLHALYALGQVAIVQGVGLPTPNRSHFESTAIWQTARLNPVLDPTGWVGRALELQSGASAQPLVGLGVGGGGLSPVLAASRAPLTSLMSLDAFTVQPDRRFPGDAPALNAAIAALYPASGGHGGAAGFVRQTGRTALDSSEALSRAVKSYVSKLDYPRGAFGDQMRLVSQLGSAGLGTRVFHLTLGGFDTHANQRGPHRALLTQLSEGMACLMEDAEVHGWGDKLAIMTYSEFGRRAQENGSGGTDHGSGSVAFVAGKSVAGGLYGTPPELARLVGGDVPGTTDFRVLYGSVLASWLGISPAKVLGGHLPRLELFRGEAASARALD